MSKSVQISNLNNLQFSSWTKVTYSENGKDKKLCSGWGSRTFFRVDKSGDIYCKKFNLLQRIAHSFGYKSDYSGKALFKHLKDKKIISEAPRKGRMDKLIARSLDTFKIECQKVADSKQALRNEFVRQTNDPTVTDVTLIDFLKANPDVSIHDKIDGFTPAFLAAKTKRLELLTHLVDQGVDVNVRCDVNNEIATTPLNAALGQSYLGMSEYLLNNGAAINAQNAAGDTPAHLLLEMLEEHNKLPYGDVNPKLHPTDIRENRSPGYIFEMLLLKKPDFNIVNHQQETAVMKAVKFHMFYEIENMLKIVDEKGNKIDNPNADVNFVNANGDNALTFAYEFAGNGMVDMLTDDFQAKISTHPQARNVLLLAIDNIHLYVEDCEKIINTHKHFLTNEAILKAIKLDGDYLVDLFLRDGTKIDIPGSLAALAQVSDNGIAEMICEKTEDDFVQREGDEALIACINEGTCNSISAILRRYENCKPSKIPSKAVFDALQIALDQTKDNAEYIRNELNGYVAHVNGN